MSLLSTEYAILGQKAGPWRVRFVGRGPRTSSPVEVLAALTPESAPSASWLEQVHSAEVVRAEPGRCGEGDALWTDRARLALAITTADCVSVLLAGDGFSAAIHAGWRGIVAGVLSQTLGRLPLASNRLRAWIGPAIGPCCYEVGEDVARAVEAAAGAPVIQTGRGPRPHLDLVAAVEAQLRARGVTLVERLSPCTRCNVESWHSFRRDGAEAGRNWAFIWRVS